MLGVVFCLFVFFLGGGGWFGLVSFCFHPFFSFLFFGPGGGGGGVGGGRLVVKSMHLVLPGFRFFDSFQPS